nr:hypothetical protein GCM10020093_025660 [Planobispora longispora]
MTDALRRYERGRSTRAARVTRAAGAESTDKYRPNLSRLLPDRLAGWAYTRWLGLISDYLAAGAGGR